MADDKNFMTRFGITDKQFDTLTTFYSLLSRSTGAANFAYRAQQFGMTSQELEILRQHALDMFISSARVLDEADKADDISAPLITDEGVGPEMHQELTMRAMVNVFTGFPVERAAETLEVTPETMKALHEIFIARLLYMGAIALRYNPEYTVPDLITGFTDTDLFCDWFEESIQYLDEDFMNAEAQAKGNENK